MNSCLMHFCRSAFAGLVVFTCTACAVDEPWGTDRTAERADRPVGVERQRVDSVVGDPDSFFLMQASHFNQAVTDLSRLALDRASDQQVRDFAQMMIDDHAELDREVRQLARDRRIALPAPPQWARQMPRSHLQSLSGREFDEEYISLMIAEHARAVAYYENALRRTIDSEVRDFTEYGLPMVRHHLEEAQELGATLSNAASNQPL